ncbi:MAG: hypothetical protein ACT4OM_06915 [Actinomycetota bacterium]
MLLLAGVPAVARRRPVQIRFPQALWFGATVFTLGSAAGLAGHHLFVSVVSGSLERRAVIVGSEVGLATALVAWGVTVTGGRWIGPFQPGSDAQEVMRSSLGLAAAAGPAVGVLLSKFVVRQLVARSISERDR